MGSGNDVLRHGGQFVSSTTTVCTASRNITVKPTDNQLEGEERALCALGFTSEPISQAGPGSLPSEEFAFNSHPFPGYALRTTSECFSFRNAYLRKNCE
jgi:hypothetical protein